MKKFLELMIEIGLVIIHFPSNLLVPFVNFDKSNPTPNQKHPVIFVERWFFRNVFHLFLKKYLEERGFLVYILNYPLYRGTFDDAALALKEFIAKNELSNIILIGISGGATTCLDYLEFHDGWDKTHKFISIGGAFYGTPLATLLSFLKYGKELSPQSKFLKRLESNIKNKRKIYAISAKIDNMIPAKSKELYGVHNIVFNMVGHNLLHTFWKPTYSLIEELALE